MPDDKPTSKAKIGERFECFTAEASAVKAAIVPRLPKGATISTVSKGGKVAFVVVAT